VVHNREAPDVAETNLQYIVIFEVSYRITKGEFMWKDPTMWRGHGV